MLHVSLAGTPPGLDLVAAGRVVEEPARISADVLQKGSCVISILLISKSEREIIVPTKGMGPEIVVKADTVEIVFDYMPQVMTLGKDRLVVVPARELFGPVTLRYSEGVNLTEMPIVLHAHQIQNKKIFVSIRTLGFLSDRLGFERIQFRKELLLFGSREDLSDAVEKVWRDL